MNDELGRLEGLFVVAVSSDGRERTMCRHCVFSDRIVAIIEVREPSGGDDPAPVCDQCGDTVTDEGLTVVRRAVVQTRETPAARAAAARALVEAIK